MGLTFVSLKAFGDFVIACHALRRVKRSKATAPAVVAGDHLRALASAIGFEKATFLTAERSGDVPAAFDLRRRGLAAGVRSLVSLRRQFAQLSGDGCYVFDRLGWRERFLVAKSARMALPESANIYEAYATALANAGHIIDDVPASSNLAIRSAVIVPASRLVEKTIPADTISAMAEQLTSRGIALEVLLLEGDRALVPTQLASTTIPRRFPALIERLKAFDLVISADSLAAHLAEFHGIKCFVVGPRPNRYWLPASCLRSEGWCLFGDVGCLTQWINAETAAHASGVPSVPGGRTPPVN